MAQTLQRAGFDTTLVSDLDRTRFWAAIDSFKGRIQKGDEIVFYFAGHGVQIGSNQLLLPVDIIRQNERQVERDGVSLVEVQDALKDARFAMFVIDACRDNPFPKIGGRSVGGEKGLLPPEPATGQIIVMAAGRNQAALDRVPDNAASNGLFTYELAKTLQQPGADVRAVLETVKERVDDKAKLVGHEQRPSFVNDLRGNFYFFGPTTVQVAPPAPVAPAAPAAVTAEQEERVFWEDAKAASNQEAYEAYLENYPKGRYASLARANLARLNAAKAAAQKLATDAAAELANKAEQERRAAEEVQKAAQRAASERVAAEAAAKEQQRLAMEAQAKEQARLALLAKEQERVAAEGAQRLAAARMAELPQPGQTIKDCADCPEMVVLPAGIFMMGSPDPQHDPFSNEKPKKSIGKPDERPQRRVQIKSFALGKYEVTQEQWYAVMGNNPSTNKGRTLPVETVSWDDTQQFIAKLNQRTGLSYRLPSEAEWEYAARAGSTNEWGSSNDKSGLKDTAWYSENSAYWQTRAVGQKLPNAFGLFDMHGNVWEWVQDCWHADYSGAPTDGSAWTTGCISSSRVRRGGSWHSDPAFLRSADRWFDPPGGPGYRDYYGNGLRLARTLVTP